jgi:hypothetical protein
MRNVASSSEAFHRAKANLEFAQNRRQQEFAEFCNDIRELNFFYYLDLELSYNDLFRKRRRRRLFFTQEEIQQIEAACSSNTKVTYVSVNIETSLAEQLTKLYEAISKFPNLQKLSVSFDSPVDFKYLLALFPSHENFSALSVDF